MGHFFQNQATKTIQCNFFKHDQKTVINIFGKFDTCHQMHQLLIYTNHLHNVHVLFLSFVYFFPCQSYQRLRQYICNHITHKQQMNKKVNRNGGRYLTPCQLSNFSQILGGLFCLPTLNFDIGNIGEISCKLNLTNLNMILIETVQSFWLLQPRLFVFQCVCDENQTSFVD